jgi:hypothetical protein
MAQELERFADAGSSCRPGLHALFIPLTEP